jgi:hypothetical protein
MRLQSIPFWQAVALICTARNVGKINNWISLGGIDQKR